MRIFRPSSFSIVFALVAGVASALGSNGVPEADYGALSWRLVGPLRGGWATVAAGVPSAEHVFYFGSADGGVWKTTDAGRTWSASFQHESVASIGGLAVAPSDPKILYVGTGQVTTRWDITSGDGVYRSNDGGATWQHRGLQDSEHIGRIWIDPRNADVVLVAALGHIFGPNAERGVFRSTDGGANWTKVLFVDADSGAVDLAADASNPDLVFAATWSARQYPWQAYFTPMKGPGSGIHRSTDGGRTWTKIVDQGLPSGSLGRIGLAVAPNTHGQMVYATIDAGDAAGLYRSEDGGLSWKRVNSDGDLAGDYFSMLAIDPHDPRKLHVMGRSIHTSTDGGKSFSITRGAPGGDDYHFLWIDPAHSERRIVASDQGAVITLNDGASWSSWFNQPTGQFYRLATDDRVPYWIYSGQQDSGTCALASRSDYGQLTSSDWHPVGGDERDCDIPFPGDPNIVFGSGLGGRLSRWDARTGQVSIVSPWPVSSYGARPETARYRTTWITPLAISKLAPHAIYQASQVLFRSLDRGDSWQVISPDLTGVASTKPDCSGDVPIERATACGYGVIFSIGLSPLDKDVIWLGTDNGFVHLSRDGGAHWSNVTPPNLRDWSKIASIDASPSDPSTAYIAVDRHRVEDSKPYVYATHDWGKTWRLSSAGLPEREYVNVVRQDPERASLLFAGTNRGAYVSFDDGALWQSLRLDLPTTGVNDLSIHGDDLIAATEGRGIWALDDLTPLRHLDAQVLAADVVLFPPAKAYRLSPNQNRDTPLPADEPRAENPPWGALIDYVLARAPHGAVALEIVDADGGVVRSFTSASPEARPNAAKYFGDEWLQPVESLSARVGHNRFAWNLRLARPRAAEYEFSIAAVPGADTPALPQGLFVLPGKYEVRLSVDGKTVTQTLIVASDPRVELAPTVLPTQFAFYREITKALEQATDARSEIDTLREQVDKVAHESAAAKPSSALRESAESLAKELGRFVGGSSPDNVAAIGSTLGTLATDLEGADVVPTAPQRELATLEIRQLDEALAHWRACRAKEVREFDQKLRDAGLPAIAP